MVDDLFARTQRAARAGAKIVVWSEDAALILKEDEAAVIERGRAMARQEGIYLQLGLMVFPPTDRFPFDENRAVLVDPSGMVVWDYAKTHPTPGPEMARMRRGDGIVPTAPSPYGRLAAVICFDMDFPTLVQQAGRARADLLLAPYLEWAEVRVTHAEIATFRAIENGVSLVRPTGDGISTAVDYQGRVLASVDSFATDDATLLAAVPTQGVPTIYGRIGDSFAYLCMAGLAALTGLTFFRRRVAELAVPQPA